MNSMKPALLGCGLESQTVGPPPGSCTCTKGHTVLSKSNLFSAPSNYNHPFPTIIPQQVNSKRKFIHLSSFSLFVLQNTNLISTHPSHHPPNTHINTKKKKNEIQILPPNICTQRPKPDCPLPQYNDHHHHHHLHLQWLRTRMIMR